MQKRDPPNSWSAASQQTWALPCFPIPRAVGRTGIRVRGEGRKGSSSLSFVPFCRALLLSSRLAALPFFPCCFCSAIFTPAHSTPIHTYLQRQALLRSARAATMATFAKPENALKRAEGRVSLVVFFVTRLSISSLSLELMVNQNIWLWITWASFTL